MNKEVKLSDMKVDAPVIKKGEKSSYVNKAQIIYRVKSYEWLEKNIDDLIDAVTHYLSTYMNPKREAPKSGGITDRRNKRMFRILEYLQELEKK